MDEYQQLIKDSYKNQQELNSKLRLELVMRAVIPFVYRTLGYQLIGANPELSKLRRIWAESQYSNVEDVTQILRDETSKFDWSNIYSFLSPKFPDLRPSQIKLFKQFESLVETFEIGQEYVIQKNTGSGKTNILSMIMQMIPQNRQIALVVPTISLGRQTLATLQKLYPHEKITYEFSGKVDNQFQKGLSGRIVVLVEDSFAKLDLASDSKIFNPSLIILDESHLLQGAVFRKSLAQYQPKALTLSFTATPDRTYLKRPKGPVEPFLVGQNIHWQPLDKKPAGKIIYRDDSQELYRNKELCNIEWQTIETNIRFEDITTIQGGLEYNEISLFQKLKAQWTNIIDAFVIQRQNKLQDRQKIMVVCPNSTDLTVEAATRYFQQTGETTAVVTSKETFILSKNNLNEKQPTTQAKVLKQFEDGEIKTVFQIRQLREGLDIPSIDCIAILDSTNSVANYLQAIGRGSRFYIDPITKAEKKLVVVDLVSTVSSQANPLTAPTALGMIIQDESGKMGFSRPKESTDDSSKNSITLRLYQSQIQDLHQNFESPRTMYKNLISEIDSGNFPELRRFKHSITPTMIRKGCVEGGKFFYHQKQFPINAVISTQQKTIQDFQLDSSLNLAISFNPCIYYFFLIDWLIKESKLSKLERIIQDAPTQNKIIKPKINEVQIQPEAEVIKPEPKRLTNTELVAHYISQILARWGDDIPHGQHHAVKQQLVILNPSRLAAIHKSGITSILNKINSIRPGIETSTCLESLEYTDNPLGILFNKVCKKLLDSSYLVNTQNLVISNDFKIFFVYLVIVDFCDNTTLQTIPKTINSLIGIQLKKLSKLCDLTSAQIDLAMFNFHIKIENHLDRINNPIEAIQTFLDYKLNAFNQAKVQDISAIFRKTKYFFNLKEYAIESVSRLKINFLPAKDVDEYLFMCHLELHEAHDFIWDLFKTPQLESSTKNSKRDAIRIKKTIEWSLSFYLLTSYSFRLDNNLLPKPSNELQIFLQSVEHPYKWFWKGKIIMLHPVIRSFFRDQYNSSKNTHISPNPYPTMIDMYNRMIKQLDKYPPNSDSPNGEHWTLEERKKFFFDNVKSTIQTYFLSFATISAVSDLSVAEPYIKPFFERNKMDKAAIQKFSDSLESGTKKIQDTSKSMSDNPLAVGSDRSESHQLILKERCYTKMLEFEINSLAEQKKIELASGSLLSQIKKLKAIRKAQSSEVLYDQWLVMNDDKKIELLTGLKLPVRSKSSSAPIVFTQASQNISREFSNMVDEELKKEDYYKYLDQKKLTSFVIEDYLRDPSIAVEVVISKISAEYKTIIKKYTFLDLVISGSFLSQVNCTKETFEKILTYISTTKGMMPTNTSKFFQPAYPSQAISAAKLFVTKQCYSQNRNFVILKEFKEMFKLIGVDDQAILRQAIIINPYTAVENGDRVYLNMDIGHELKALLKTE